MENGNAPRDSAQLSVVLGETHITKHSMESTTITKANATMF